MINIDFKDVKWSKYWLFRNGSWEAIFKKHPDGKFKLFRVLVDDWYSPLDNEFYQASCNEQHNLPKGYNPYSNKEMKIASSCMGRAKYEVTKLLIARCPRLELQKKSLAYLSKKFSSNYQFF